MGNRHALLIGVPRYDDEEFNLERLEAAVRCDIAAMRAALDQSDYTITECGIGNAERGGATLSRINHAIEELGVVRRCDYDDVAWQVVDLHEKRADHALHLAGATGPVASSPP